MRTQITCPACRTPYAAEVHQIVDAGQHPELKEALISGYLNVAQCPSCGAVTQISGPILYHDPDHELFMVHVPFEMGLPAQEQEQLIGRMIQQAMDSLPPSERRGYMFQPQMIISMQTFMEKVFETEGITPEMLARQQSQSELIQEMITADRDMLNQLIRDNQEMIDETFFAMLRAMKEAADGSDDEATALKLTNVQARLYRETDVGRRLERQQKALHEFSQEVRRANGLTPDLLLKHVLANRNDESVVIALIMSGQNAFNYQFFLLLSERIEKRQKAGIDVSELLSLRESLLNIQQEMEERSKEELEKAQKTLLSILESNDKVSSVKANLSNIDDTVLYILSASIQQAEKQGDTERAVALQEVQAIIANEVEQQAPPEIRMVNRLVRAQNPEEQQKILDENSDLIRPELVQVLNLLVEDAKNRGQEELRTRLQIINGLIESHLVS
ncbi:MAG: CpXC domain-containing protein [Candidatus Promineifilaceae bacterium]